VEYAPNKFPTGETNKGLSWDLFVWWMSTLGGCRGISMKDNKENFKLHTRQIMKL